MSAILESALTMVPTSGAIVAAILSAIQKSSDVSNNGNIEEMEQEALKQEIFLKLTAAQAKVAQEISIARRIDTAEEVIIEEIYDATGEGAIGVKLGADGPTAGISGSGRNISKRIYTFKGWREGGLETADSLLNRKKPEDG